MIATNGKKACVIMNGDKVVTKILVLQPVYELEGDMLLKFAADIKKGTTLFMIDDSTEVTANDDYKAGDYLYFSKGTFHPTRVRLQLNDNIGYNYYTEMRFLKGFDNSSWTNMNSLYGYWGKSIVGLSQLKVVDCSHLDTSNVTSMNAMFANCSSLTSLDVSSFDTSKVTGMSTMFCYCSSLTSLNVSKWNTSEAQSFNRMFFGCSSLTSLDVSGWDTSKVTSFSWIFYGCSSLTSLNVSKWNTSEAQSLNRMFCNCSSLSSLDVSSFDTSKVTDMGFMFYGCTSLTNLLFGSKWGTQTSTAANALTLDLSTLGLNKSYKLTDATYTSMLTMYDRASAGLTTMTIKFSKKHNLPDGFAEKMSALGYTIQLV